MIFSASAPRFQSTHPRGVRPVLYPCVLCQIPISIHAPARGATLCSTLCLLGICISIHAPARGATSVRQAFSTSRTFQSTHPRGVRPRFATLQSRASSISIHAPARGATSRVHHASRQSIFQSTHPRGVRHIARQVGQYARVFQSTHPRGVRLSADTMRDE